MKGFQVSYVPMKGFQGSYVPMNGFSRFVSSYEDFQISSMSR